MSCFQVKKQSEIWTLKKKINNDWNGIVNICLKNRRFRSSGTMDRKKRMFCGSAFSMTREQLKFKSVNKHNNLRILFENKKPLIAKNKVQEDN